MKPNHFGIPMRWKATKILQLRCTWGAWAALDEGDSVPKGQSDALRFAADAHVPAQLAIGIVLLLYAHVHKGVLAEHAHRVEVRGLQPRNSKRQGPSNTISSRMLSA